MDPLVKAIADRWELDQGLARMLGAQLIEARPEMFKGIVELSDPELFDFIVDHRKQGETELAELGEIVMRTRSFNRVVQGEVHMAFPMPAFD